MPNFPPAQASIARLREYVKTQAPALASVLIGVLVFVAILIVGMPTQLEAMTGRGVDWTFFAGALLLYVAYRVPGWLGMTLAWSLSLAPFAIVLSGLWHSNFGEYSAIGGLLPWSDASNYYHESRRLLEGYQLSSWGSRRPLAHSMLVLLLGLTQQNLQLALALQVLITAMCCYVLAHEVRRSHGPAAGTLTLAMLFLYYRLYIGTTMSENVGVALGSIGLAILWRGTGRRSISIVALGLLVLTLALNARAGAFFVLPLLLVWGTWFFRGSARLSLRFLAVGLGMIMLGFALNSVMLRVLADPNNSMASSNYAYTLYGLATGGKGWTQIYVDHPEVRGLTEVEAAKQIYQFAFDTIRAHPAGLISGMWVALQSYFDPNGVGELSYVPAQYVRAYLHGVFLFGLLFCGIYWKRDYPSLLLAAIIGVILSTPLVPPSDTGSMRAYAATMPMTAAFVAVSAVSVMSVLTLIRKVAHPMQQASTPLLQGAEDLWQLLRQPLLAFGIGLSVFITLGPVAVRLSHPHPPQFNGAACPAPMETVYARMSSGSSVVVVPDPSTQSSLPVVRKDQFLTNLRGSGVEIQEQISAVFAAANHPLILMNLFELSAGRYVWLIAEPAIMTTGPGVVQVCGDFATDPALAKYRFFFAKTITPVVAKDR